MIETRVRRVRGSRRGSSMPGLARTSHTATRASGDRQAKLRERPDARVIALELRGAHDVQARDL